MTEEMRKAKEIAASYDVEAIAMSQTSPASPNRDRDAQDLKAQMAKQGIHLSDRDERIWQAYLASKQEREEVYRRLANS